MSVDCRIVVGLTLPFPGKIDWDKVEEFTKKYPELDEHDCRFDEKEGKLLLIGDGMNGDFLRLVLVDKIIEDLYELDFVGLPMNRIFSTDILYKMSDLYEEYTGTKPNPEDFKYAMWSQWS